tara:strand:+ start:223 stop:456 length:234 start_codon:yes stop_codon:yes gene_type:complete
MSTGDKMIYQIYNIKNDNILVTAESFEEAQEFLSLYEDSEKIYLEIRPVYKEDLGSDEVTQEMAKEADEYNPEQEWL